MAKSIVIPLTSLVTVSGTVNLRQADTTTAALYLRRFNDAGTYVEEITGTNLGNGDWQFDCPEGNYQLWKSAYPDATAGNRIDKWHGGAAKYRRIQDEEDAAYVKKAGDTMSGNLAMGTNKVTGLAAATANGDAIRFEQGLRVDGASQSVDKVIVFNTGSLPQTQGTRTYVSDRQLTDVEEVNYLINQAVSTQFQESVNHVRVFPDGVEVTGQVYTNPVSAAASFASPSDTNRCQIEIVGMGASLNYINGATGTLVDYVNYKGAGQHIWLALTEATKSAHIKFENMTVILGTYGATVGARTFTNFEFHNCIVYHYHNVTLTGTTIRDSIFLGSSTYKVTLAGVCNIINGSFNNALTDGGTGVRIFNDNFTWNPPTDPTAP